MHNITTEDIGHVFSKIIVDEENGCWKFPISKTSQRYATLSLHGKNYGAHRVFYAWFHGDIPQNLDIHHMCNVTTCIKPSHLQAISHRLNVLLIEHNDILRTERLTNLLEASLPLQLHGTARLTSQQLKEIFGCRQDNGNNIVKVLMAMAAVYPGQFSFQRTGKARRQPIGRPMYIYEIPMGDCLRRELLHDDTHQDESLVLSDQEYVDDLHTPSTALVMA